MITLGLISLIVLKIVSIRNWKGRGIMRETMANRKKLRSNSLYYNLGLAVIWDIIGFFIFFLSLLGVGIPVSFILDFVAVGTALIFRYLHKMYFFKVQREIKGEYRELDKAVKKSGKKALAQKYAKIRGSMDLWMSKGKDAIMREMVRLLFTLLAELIPFFGDFSPTWTIKAYYELYRFGLQKRKYQNLIYQMDAMKALLKADQKLRPGYESMRRGLRSAQRGMNRGESEGQESTLGQKQYQGMEQGGASPATSFTPSQRPSLAGGAAGSYQQSREQAVEYDKMRSQGKTYVNNNFRQNGGNLNVRDGSFREVSGAPEVTTASFQSGSPGSYPSSDSSIVVNEKGVSIGSGVGVNGQKIGGSGVQTQSGQGVNITDRGVNVSPSNNKPK